MTEKEKLEAQIEQNQADQKALVAECDLIKAKLAVLAKPELRHGDYGYDYQGALCMTLYSADKQGLREMGWANFHDNTSSSERQRPDNKIGNIFDDLKELAEPLKTIKMGDVHGDDVEVSINNTGKIAITTNRKTWVLLTLDQAKDFSMKLRRVIRTAEQKDA